MITKEKLSIYARYNGDNDAWARSGSRKEHSLIEDQDWYTIDGLIQDLSLILKGLASTSYNENINVKLSNLCDSEETIRELKKMAIQ